MAPSRGLPHTTGSAGGADYARRTFRIVAVGAEDASRAEPEFLHEVYR